MRARSWSLLALSVAFAVAVSELVRAPGETECVASRAIITTPLPFFIAHVLAVLQAVVARLACGLAALRLLVRAILAFLASLLLLDLGALLGGLLLLVVALLLALAHRHRVARRHRDANRSCWHKHER